MIGIRGGGAAASTGRASLRHNRLSTLSSRGGVAQRSRAPHTHHQTPINHHNAFTTPNYRKSFSTLARGVTAGKNSSLVIASITGCVTGATVAAGIYKMPMTQMEAPKKDDDKQMDAETQSVLDDVMEFLGLKSSKKEEESSAESDEESAEEGAEQVEDDEANTSCGPGKRVKVSLDPELVESLPTLPLSEVSKPTGENKGKMLVSHEGIIYDVTEFVNHHPGGKDLVLTANGLDLGHFFDNYTVHGNSEKAAGWLQSMAVAKLSPEDTKAARERTTAVVHVEQRHVWLNKARRRIVFIAATLPMWMTVRGCVRFVGWFIPSLGRVLARLVPVSVPGLSVGAEPLKIEEDAKAEEDKAPTVAVIGGGIAGCGTAWSLRQSGFKVTLFEARQQISGNARTFDWDFSPFRSAEDEQTVKSCCSVTAWPPLFYKNYTCLLNKLNIETVHQPLSWFLNSKVPGATGTLWAADPTPYDGSLRNVLKKDFAVYEKVVRFSDRMCNLLTFRWAPWRWNDTPSMYDSHTGLGLLNPMNVVPLYSLFRLMGGSELWWQTVFTPHYTASFLVDELRPFPAVFGPLIEAQIPLLPNKDNAQSFKSDRNDNDCNITTCQTWKDAGKGIREVFDKLVQDIDLREDTRIREVEVLPNGKKRVHDEFDNYIDVDRVVFACPANAVGNIYKRAGWLANTIFSTLVYADDHHPDSGHMHAVLHSDGTVIEEQYREDCLRRASNYVEVTEKPDGSINIENQYNFGVQTPGPGVYDLPLDKKPVMLISHALGEGKSIDEKKIVGTANHARAHPLYSGWNVMAMLSLRLVQGKNGIYYCSNWTTPGNCHDMSFLSGLVCAHAIGAKYPFEQNVEAKKDFGRMRDLMGF
ncbi:putative fatty acid hydroxylase-related protein [Skeletonema marinoi]|uniref:Fatty acid hydroxylase-related protein n=1 Tax=Skeletonema marinoi TaxID=267567 RepID=A0AAD9DH95_9STRA|nr:putative fatty acid hydroxylase-related protein [Skeletonema marinoi]